MCRGRQVLIGKRKGSHGSGTWALPGGHLELGESFEACAVREVMEETGLAIRDVTFAYAVNSVFSEAMHYVTIFMRADVDEAAEARLMEPDKCEGWEWAAWGNLPAPRFLPLEVLLASPFQLFG